MLDSTAYYPSLLPGKTSVTLVVHGLNLRPEAMHFLINWLNSQGSDVYLVLLSGHRKGGPAITAVTREIWQQELQAGYAVARKAALAGSMPLYFLGYSLGALLGQSMLALHQPQMLFDKQVLLAPAIAIRSRAYLLKLLFFLDNKTSLPSYTPQRFRVNESLPLQVYRILFSEEKMVWEAVPLQLDIPTIVFMDPKDELVSYKRIMRLVNRKRLTNYRVMALKPALQHRKGGYHHLMIDAETMGLANWEWVAAEIKAFLFE